MQSHTTCSQYTEFIYLITKIESCNNEWQFKRYVKYHNRYQFGFNCHSNKQPDRQRKRHTLVHKSIRKTTETAEVNYKFLYRLFWWHVYLKLWSPPQLTANHAGKLEKLYSLTKDRHAFCSLNSLISWRDVRMGHERMSLQLIGNAQVNHVSEVKEPKTLIKL